MKIKERRKNKTVVRETMPKLHTASLLICGLLTLIMTAKVRAGLPTANRDGVYSHDGVLVRLRFGPAYGSVSGEKNASRLEIRGPGLLLDVAVGGAITQNIALHGSFVLHGQIDPSISMFSASDNMNNNLFGLVGGISYYILPWNIFVSAEAGFARMALEDSGGQTIAGTSPGFLGQTSIGKEWWISSNWGLGISGVFNVGILPGKGDDPLFTWFGGSLALSATYN